jgi:hypothetical protein
VKLSFKPTKVQLIAIGVAAVAAFGLMANGSASEDQPPAAGPLDTHARQACDDFEAGYPDAGSKPERLTLADKVTTSTRRTGNEAIRDRGVELGLRAGDGGAPWRSSADALTSACRDAGWSAP